MSDTITAAPALTGLGVPDQIGPSDWQPQPGDRVSVWRRTEVGHTGTQQDWWVSAPGRAHDGPLGPAWSERGDSSVQWHGWGAGTVASMDGDVCRVELDA